MKRKTQELTLIFGEENTGKSNNIVKVLRNRRPEEKVYIIDYKGKYKNLLLEERIAFNYHKLQDTRYCNPLLFEPYIYDLKGEDYSYEYLNHLEEAVKIINSAPFTPLSDITTRKVLTKMYMLVGITPFEYSPISHFEKTLTIELFFKILEEVDPEGYEILQPAIKDLKREANCDSLKQIFVPNHTFDTSADINIIDLNFYLAGEEFLTDLKLESMILKITRRMRNEGRAIVLVVDNLWPMGQGILVPFYRVSNTLKTFYLHDEFATFRKLNEEAIHMSEEIHFYRSNDKDASVISEFFNEPMLQDHILSLPNEKSVTIRPVNDIAQFGDYYYYKNKEVINEWKIDWGNKV